jgi:hypothetical protein
MGKGSRISSAEAIGAFIRRGTCSEALFAVLNRAWGHPLPHEEQASAPLAGGIVQHGRQCGMIWGATLAAGAEAHRRFGAGPQAEVMATLAAARVASSFRAQNGATDCQDITGLNIKSTPLQMTVYFLLKGGTISCFRVSGRYAPLALAEIEAAFADARIKPPAAPVSCAAALARRLGASEPHAIMAAGLAGGIGLSGGGCGALGAAIWLGGVNTL